MFASAGGELHMFARFIQIFSAFLFASILAASSPVLAGDDGIITMKSAYPIGETIERLKKDIAGKGIKFFDEIGSIQTGSGCGHHAPTVGATDLRKPAA